jgi:predicted DNA-binding transcriptional regulator AlpA
MMNRSPTSPATNVTLKCQAFPRQQDSRDASMSRLSDIPDEYSRPDKERDENPVGTVGPSESPLIDAKAFATLLRCSTKHIRRMADAGRCPPPIRLGSLLRWNRKVVDEWIAAGCPMVRAPRMSNRKFPGR